MKSGIPVAVNFQVMQSFMTVALPLPFLQAAQTTIQPVQPAPAPVQPAQTTMQPVRPAPALSVMQPVQPTPVQPLPTPQPAEDSFGGFSVAAPAAAPANVEDEDEFGGEVEQGTFCRR